MHVKNNSEVVNVIYEYNTIIVYKIITVSMVYIGLK